MKRTFSALFESIKRKKWKSFVAMLCLVALLVTLGCRGNQPMAPDGSGGDSSGVTTTTTAATTATIKDEPLATTTGDETTGATTTVDTSSMDETVTTTQGGSASVTKATVSKPTKTQATKVTKTTSGKQPPVVQEADFRTGVSWDGKSPIVYTYPDGSTGTVPKDGATYEVLPGLVSTYYAPTDIKSSGHCSDCGKVMGDGKNGTCVVWMMGAEDCPNCGEHVEPYVCHTCEE